MAPPRAAAGVSIPADPAADSPEAESESKLRQGAADARWLETLSEPELDVLVSLREVAVTRASDAGHPGLADTVFHLRALRALGVVLLEELKERLRQSSADANVLDRSALLDDPEASQDHQMPAPNGIHKKRKNQTQDGWDGDGAQSPKRRKTT
ncbi:uncharacterized protein [Zea mays]|uniref:Uncharacterized protein n=1 Tax=Zea mays TaxID=4577 RepID=A0A1D6GX79_MAIZE|nr:uncharacterized protein LOC103626489 isoform X1 [Zea mays]AQK67439.1 hypothetical protein ZEAMMB73_Zm00001d014889 [Zea mays]|eukprot:XP_008645127.1 uncharacterized protein LOC103626489 isoform X1 [Zea mays]